VFVAEAPSCDDIGTCEPEFYVDDRLYRGTEVHTTRVGDVVALLYGQEIRAVLGVPVEEVLALAEPLPDGGGPQRWVRYQAAP
jgi:hypothetical protein